MTERLFQLSANTDHPYNPSTSPANGFRPGPQDYYESWLIGTVFSAMSYGVVLTMAVTCFHLLLKNPYSPTLSVRRFYYGYIISMVMLSTATMVSAISSLSGEMFKEQPLGTRLPEPSLPVRTWGAPFITMATWGADGFMMWRCYKLYLGNQKTHPMSRFTRISICMFLFSLAAISIGSGVTFIIVKMDKGWLLAIFIAVTAVVNIALAVLITGRILGHRAKLREDFGPESTSPAPYKKVIEICVESAAIMVVFNIVYLAMDFEEFLGTVILINILVHVYTISPFLIIYRVSHGNMKSVPVSLSGMPTDEEHGVRSVSPFRAASPPSLQGGRNRHSRLTIDSSVGPEMRDRQSTITGSLHAPQPLLSQNLRGKFGPKTPGAAESGEVRRGSW
ncbi:hypothetical protein CPB83DRAFT_845591 [Crepidotus variabilis]|uniref:Uncharacterized protein n=1 Tax=Crepidotus variabilis TaxID=179855 RepID=A0A9P6JUN8_9AGAR|nr:hypothetical protein CPB83DRAFT_845591 [Crepidotus variabilis]